MKKKVVVIIRQTPFNTARNKEGLRMCVGTTLTDNEVTVIFLGPGVISAGRTRPEIIGAMDFKQEFETFSMMKMKLLAEKEAVELYRVELINDVESIGMDEIAMILADSDVVIPW
jgi:sulfur relay (sulfurtransferase) DsrF/TusC family protein